MCKVIEVLGNGLVMWIFAVGDVVYWNEGLLKFLNVYYLLGSFDSLLKRKYVIMLLISLVVLIVY